MEMVKTPKWTTMAKKVKMTQKRSPNFLVKMKWKEIWSKLLKKNLESKMLSEEKMKSSKSKSLEWTQTLNSMTSNQMFKWMSISILTLLQMCIKSESILKRHKIGTIKWPLSFKLNSMKNKLNVMRLNNSSKNWKGVLPKMQCFQELVKRFLRKLLKSGKKVSL